MPSYDRDRAISEAQAFWDKPCKDGKISRIGAAPLDVEHEWRKLRLPPPRSTWSARFLPNFLNPATGSQEFEVAAFVQRVAGSPLNPPTPAVIVFHGWDGLGDCAHFMSQCLQAGGLSIAATDFVPTLESSLRALSITKTLALKVPEERAKRIIGVSVGSGPLLKKGDVIFYYDPTGAKIKGFGAIYHHSALFSDTGKITCHTKSRFSEDWLISGTGDTDLYTLIHFKEDDLPIPSGLATALKGWWDVRWQGKSYYYYYEPDGRVGYTAIRPKATSQRLPNPEGAGYWFPKGASAHIICWTKSGSVEELALGPSGREQTGKWNDADPLSAKKIG